MRIEKEQASKMGKLASKRILERLKKLFLRQNPIAEAMMSTDELDDFIQASSKAANDAGLVTEPQILIYLELAYFRSSGFGNNPENSWIVRSLHVTEVLRDWPKHRQQFLAGIKKGSWNE